MAQKQIEIFENTITAQLLGPGSDVELRLKSDNITHDSPYEVIADFPLYRYYTGILFPKKIIKDQEEQDTQRPDDSEIDNDAQDETIDTRDEDSITESEDETVKKMLKMTTKKRLVYPITFIHQIWDLAFVWTKTSNH